MTDTTMTGAKAPLGVGSIVSSSFSILFSNFVKVIVLGFTAALLGFLVNALILGPGVALGVQPPDVSSAGGVIFGTVFSGLVNIVIYGLVTALLIQLAYDAKLGRSNSLGAYFASAIPALLPIIVLSIVISILAAFGLLALIIGAFWVYAVFYVMAPVAVIERGGFGSMGRSAALTKEYRWPIVGLFLIITIIVMVINLVAGFAIGAAMLGAPGEGTLWLGGLLLSLLSAFGYGLSGIATALTYARLREIKEGVAVDEIASVFD